MLNQVSTKAQLKKALSQRGFTLTDAMYYPNYRNVSNVDCWTIHVECLGNEYVIEADTVQELLLKVESDLM